MNESFSNKKNQEDRDKVAKQIRAARKYERKWEGVKMNYNVDRGVKEYMIVLRGFEKIFEYLKTKKITKVLNIGSGSGRAIDEISRSDAGQGLEFVQTALTKNSENKNGSHMHLTSAEVLRGIPSNYFGAVLAVFSVNYSEAPELVAEQIDRVLVPGGVFKGAFASAGSGEKKFDENLRSRSYDLLRLALRRKGYDCATLPETFIARRQGDSDYILLAIKPGPSMTSLSAKDLLSADYKEFMSYPLLAE